MFLHRADSRNIKLSRPEGGGLQMFLHRADSRNINLSKKGVKPAMGSNWRIARRWHKKNEEFQAERSAPGKRDTSESLPTNTFVQGLKWRSTIR